LLNSQMRRSFERQAACYLSTSLSASLNDTGSSRNLLSHRRKRQNPKVSIQVINSMMAAGAVQHELELVAHRRFTIRNAQGYLGPRPLLRVTQSGRPWTFGVAAFRGLMQPSLASRRMADQSTPTRIPDPPIVAPGRGGLRRTLAGSVLTGVASQAGLVVSGTLVARMLSVEHRGALALIVVIPIVFASIGTLAVPLAVTFDIARPGGRAAAALAAAAPLAVVQTAAISGCCFVASILLLATRSPDVRITGVVAIGYVPASVALQYGLAALLGLGRFHAFNVLRLAPGLIYAMYALVASILGGVGLAWLVIAWVSAYAIAGVLTLVHLRRVLDAERPKQRRDDLEAPSTGSLVRFGVRSLVGSLSPLGSLGADQLVAGLVLSPAGLGLYVVASSICNLPRFVAQSIGLVAYPHVAALPKGAQSRATIRLVLATSAAIGLTIIGLEIAAGVIVPLFFGSAYVAAVPVARILLVTALLFGIQRVLSDSVRGAGHLMDGTLAEGISWLALTPLIAAGWGSLDVISFSVALTVAAAAGLAGMVTIVGLRRVMNSSRARQSGLA
jgi:O-antigen/teichoic acid export membrane protein